MIVILNGPPGIGKTTIAYKLTKKLRRSIVIEVDKVKYFAIDDKRLSDSLDIGDQQVLTMTRALRDTKEFVILDYIFQTKKYFQAFVRQLRAIDRKIYAYRLRSLLSENLHRDKRRPPRMRLGPQVKEISKRLDELGDAVGYTVETTGLSVEKSAEKVYLLIESEIGAAPGR